MKCPAGHESAATDYCDICGEAMDPAASRDSVATATESPDASAGATGVPTEGDPPCPNCGIPNPPEALFCENCGYDHTTGAMPRREDPAASTAPDTNTSPALAKAWVAEVWIDPQWYAAQESPDPLPSPGLPAVVVLKHTSLLIGRTSVSRGITPDIDCGNDNGVSRRHAQLTTDGTRWFVEDLQSSNGTFVGDATGTPPTSPIAIGRKVEVAEDARIYVGSWTRIVLREALDGEV